MGVIDSLIKKVFSCASTCPLTCISVSFFAGISIWLWKLLKPKGRNPFNINSVRPKEKLETDVKKRDAILKQVSVIISILALRITYLLCLVLQGWPLVSPGKSESPWKVLESPPGMQFSHGKVEN